MKKRWSQSSLTGSQKMLPTTRSTSGSLQDSKSNSSLVEIVRRKKKISVSEIIQNTYDVNSQDSDSRTALHYSVLRFDYPMTKALLMKNANMYVMDKWGKSPAEMAIEQNAKDICGLFEDHDKEMKRVLSFIRVFALRLENRPESYPSGWTHLHEACSKGDKILVERLIKSGFNVNRQTASNACRALYTPLHVASCVGHSDCLKILIENGADVNCKTASGEKAIHLAARFGHKKIVEYLVGVSDGRALQATDDRGNTPVHHAAQGARLEVLTYLVTSGAQPDHRNHDGNSPLDVATSMGHKAISRFLLSIKNTDSQSRPNPKVSFIV